MKRHLFELSKGDKFSFPGRSTVYCVVSVMIRKDYEVYAVTYSNLSGTRNYQPKYENMEVIMVPGESGITKQNATNISHSPRKVEGNFESYTTIELPTLEGDTQVYLGQTIVAIIRLNIENDIVYSKEMQHGFKTELMASILEELNISLDDIAKVYQDRDTVED